jgi:hypothetical protein
VVDRPSFSIVLQPLPNVDGTRAIRALLKIALRGRGLRSLSVREIGDDPLLLEPALELDIASAKPAGDDAGE